MAARKANIVLVQAAIEAAIGYDFEETVEEFKNFPKYGEQGSVGIVPTSQGKKVYKKHAKKDPSLLKFILTNRLPEYFSDSKKIEINKTSIEIKDVTASEIKGFAGRLLDVIDAEFVETKD